jgi:hypothetical protein
VAYERTLTVSHIAVLNRGQPEEDVVLGMWPGERGNPVRVAHYGPLKLLGDQASNESDELLKAIIEAILSDDAALSTGRAGVTYRLVIEEVAP